MDVIIAGAGIGGLALAHGLLADGHRVRVLEQAPAPRTGGAGVTIFSNGAAALAGLGVPLDGLGAIIDDLDIRSADGRRVLRFDLRVMRRHTGFPVVTLPRDRLIARLSAELPGDVILFGHGVTAVTVDDTVTVTDAAGRRHAADVVVGADGHRSAVRRSVLDPTPATENGWVTWQGLTPVLPAVTSGLFIVGDAGACGLMPAGDGLLQWWFDMPDPGGFGAGAADLLRERFAGYADPVPALLATVTDADLGCFPHALHRVPDRWGVGPTTLVGDAAHVFPPSQAQGANQALEDAWLLRRALRTPGPAALRRYEVLRSRRVRRVSAMAASEVTNRPAGTVARLTAPLVPAAVTGRGYLALIRRFSSVLHDERI